MLTAKYLHTEAGTTFDRWNADTKLELGKEYHVRKVDMGAFRTDIQLAEAEGTFNSMLFDFYEDGKLVNIYRSTKYNPMARRTRS